MTLFIITLLIFYKTLLTDPAGDTRLYFLGSFTLLSSLSLQKL